MTSQLINQGFSMTQYRLYVVLSLFMLLGLAGCQATSKQVISAELGTPVSTEEMLSALASPGSIQLTKHLSAHWQVPLSGLVNLKHPTALAANLTDRDEPIEIYTYSLIHPELGNYLIDSGVSTRFSEPDNNQDVSFLVKTAMNTDQLKVVLTTQDIAKQLGGIDGVFLTHIHLDHIMGLTDLDDGIPVYLGKGDASLRDFMNLFTMGTTNRLLQRQTHLNEWDHSVTSYIDVFGDGSVFAIAAPGHTPGTTAYIANTTDGVQLMLGDVTHTRWGWENQVEPGTYSVDQPQSAKSLLNMIQLAEAIVGVKVHPGHQSLSAQ